MAAKNQHFNIQELADKWAKGKLAPEEQAYLEQYYAEFNDEHISVTDSRHANADALQKAMLDQINAEISYHEKPVRSLWPWKHIAAAASVLIAVSAGGYFLLHKKAANEIAQVQKQDLLPGGNKAVLISGGRKIILTNSPNGTIAQNQNVLVSKLVGGKVDYKASSNNSAGNALIYDTLITKKGGTYQVKLSDGTQVWLNADSKLRYPETFVGNERKVELISGEAYFAVVHNAKQPFRVATPKQVVEDIGTEFNVNAYPDEPSVKTTLIEGSIKIQRGTQNVLLTPGQQAIVSYAGSNDKISIKKDADIDGVVAWKNGLFHFDNSDLRETMKQIARWYDVEVVYEGKIPNSNINGEAYRNMKASQVFEVLSYLKVNFRIEGKKIIVTNKSN